MNKFLQVLLFSLIYSSGFSQTMPCYPSTTQSDLDANKIRARIRGAGDMFWDGSKPKFIVNAGQPGMPEVSSIFTSVLWMTAIDQNQVRKLSAKLYDSEKLSYLPYGKNQSECSKWDRHWKINYSDIKSHIDDWKDNNKIDFKNEAVYGWPGKGNPYFKQYNGFEMTTELKRMAPFYDENKDFIYNPDDGDYPALFDITTGKVFVPTQIIWHMFNDNAVFDDPTVKPLNIVTQVTSWAIVANKGVLASTVFVNHTMLYQGTETLKEFKAGLFVDLDLGCGEDDYIGSSKDLSSFFAYNSDTIDGSSGSSCSGTNTFGDDPGVQSVTILSDSMSSFIYLVNSANSPNTYPPIMNHPDTYEEFLNYMDAKFTNGSHLKNDGNGTIGVETNYAFDGNPNIPGDWSMKSENLDRADEVGIATINFGDLNPGDIKSFTTAYSYFNNPDLKSTSVDIDSMYAGIKQLRAGYHEYFKGFITATNEINESAFVIAPNPASSTVRITFDNNQQFDVTLLDIFGRHLNKIDNAIKETSVDISNYPPGLYIIYLYQEGKSISKKLIITK